ncbi:MAG: rubredoxin [Planctomycetota bacterium]|jgi:rubredoxin
MKRYVCRICSHAYDPLDGDPEAGIEPMTSFLDLPFEWVCPECGAGRRRFVREDSLPRRRARGPSGGR